MNWGKCERCGKSLRGRRSDTRFCGETCKQAARRARQAGRDVPVVDTATISTVQGYLDAMSGVAEVLLQRRGTLTPGESRWLDMRLRMLPSLESLDSAAYAAAREQGEVIGRVIQQALTSLGISWRDPAVGQAVADAIREVCGVEDDDDRPRRRDRTLSATAALASLPGGGCAGQRAAGSADSAG